jgi:hypothetical protein
MMCGASCSALLRSLTFVDAALRTSAHRASGATGHVFDAYLSLYNRDASISEADVATTHAHLEALTVDLALAQEKLTAEASSVSARVADIVQRHLTRLQRYNLWLDKHIPSHTRTPELQAQVLALQTQLQHMPSAATLYQQASQSRAKATQHNRSKSRS